MSCTAERSSAGSRRHENER